MIFVIFLQYCSVLFLLLRQIIFNVPEEAGDDPRCPKCSRTEAVEPADDSALKADSWRQWLVVFALLFIAGIAYVVFE